MWKPTLASDLEGRAAEAHRAILQALRRPASDLPVPISPEDLAVAWAYLSDDDGSDEPWFEAAVIDLVSSVQSERAPIWLHGGLLGKAWTLAHIGDDEAVTYLGSFDEHLVAALRQADWTGGNYDLIGGLAGIGIYGLERWQRGDHDLARTVLTLVATRLTSLATRDGGMCRWVAHKAGIDVMDCGVAHGVAGAMAVLANIAQTGVANTSDLVGECMRWLTAQMLPEGPYGRFPAAVSPGQQAHPTRLAWCYGDLGIAAAMWSAARRLGWNEAPGLELARGCARRELAHAGVMDAGLCHGAIGNAHIFNRFYHASGEALFREAANRWFAQAFTYINPELAFGGFGQWKNASSPVPSLFESNGSLLEGAIGVALGLAAATSHTEPGWDRLLAVDIPLSPP